MIELIRRLDRRAGRSTSPASARGRVVAARSKPRASGRRVSVRGFARPATLRRALRVRALVPRAPHRGRAHARALREHLRPARRGARRRAGADRQPARDQPRQDRADRSRCSAPPTASRTRSSPTRAPRPTARGGRRPARIACRLPNGLDLDRFRARARRGAARARSIVVANLRPEKGHDVLIDAAADAAAALSRRALRDRRRRVRARATLRALATALGVEAHAFTFLGHRDDVPALLAAADIFVLPSRSEAFPNGALEAMAAGLPIVASARRRHPRTDRGRAHRLLVPPGDPAHAGRRRSAR